jgi:uncharacterized protein (TIGR03435 family)
MNTFLASAIALSAIGAFAAQSADQPRFEAASVKRTDQCTLKNTVDPGMIALNGDPLKVVLGEAFSVKMDQIIGPSWLDADCFVINAKIPLGATKDQLPTMLQALLVERFKLAVHKESRPRPGYALVVDKNGPTLKASDPSPNAAGPPAGQVTFSGTLQSKGIKGSISMATLARLLSGSVAGPVEDLTGLNGRFDVDISWALDPAFERPGAFAIATAEAHPNADLPPAPTADLFAAIRESLGLRLEARKEQVEVVVIDSIERVPTEN